MKGFFSSSTIRLELFEKNSAIFNMSKGKISLIGIGRLGICTAMVFEKAGYEVLGVDINEDYVNKINNKSLISYEPHVCEMLAQSKNFRATTNQVEAINFSDMIFICVDTPSTGDDRYYDTFKLTNVLTSINAEKPSNKHIMIMCTVLPGYIRNEGRQLIKDCTNCTLNYNPEFIAQGAIIHGFLNPDVVLIGAENETAASRIKEIYVNSVANQPHYAIMAPESAEVMKISLNCFVTTKIAYANMIADIADKTPGANKFDILKAVGMDSRVGMKCLMPGWSYGGPCFPRDNRALAGYADKIGIDAKISKATNEINLQHVDFMAQNYLEKNKDTYVFEHIAYKQPCDVPITEESAKCFVAVKLAKAGKTVILRDQPHILEDAKRLFGKEADFVYEDIATPRDPATIDG
ncbi:UDP-glucose/GDP-mannose dehydrogenase [Tritrichomonas foetus]|uniref:UDP-glucose/GDP-mannose dehydrogenase n=1 Tax=Tritrichomonas foetus TaxID=1144522 RepID=A0A1J4JJB1_9EUKA|nr:UDP-glucose/GDP-mannose dehydrogenase [Tritrichomonas foetus]|eukprot:OHS99240.1 UDP-glucose/GDP-mannose dehydrogenase [Tritrichomonas foetus]